MSGKSVRFKNFILLKAHLIHRTDQALLPFVAMETRPLRLLSKIGIRFSP